MSDLTERLRKMASAPWEHEGGSWPDQTVEAVAEIERLQAALRAAEMFIVNGVELGFIRMPDPDTPDPAHNVLPMIRSALSGKGE